MNALLIVIGTFMMTPEVPHSEVLAAYPAASMEQCEVFEEKYATREVEKFLKLTPHLRRVQVQCLDLSRQPAP